MDEARADSRMRIGVCLFPGSVSCGALDPPSADLRQLVVLGSVPDYVPDYRITVEATEESVLNSLLRATTAVGRDGNTRQAIDIQQMLPILRKYNVLDWDKRIPPWGKG